jgi:hypothetical protein
MTTRAGQAQAMRPGVALVERIRSAIIGEGEVLDGPVWAAAHHLRGLHRLGPLP